MPRNHRPRSLRTLRLHALVVASVLSAMSAQLACSGNRSAPEEHVAATSQPLSVNQFYGASLPAKTLALTFDDGPGEFATYSGQNGEGTGISQYLRSKGIRAAFFDIGGHVRTTDLPNPLGISVTPKAAAILAQIVSDGHLIGNHTMTHRDLVTEVLPTGASQVIAELTQADVALSPYMPAGTFLFRAPYTSYDQGVYDAIAPSAVDEYVGPVDADIGGVNDNYPGQAADWACWQGQETDADGNPAGAAGTGYLTTQECGDAYLAEIESVGRGIVLMHEPFSWAQGNTLAMVEYIVPILISKGYSFVRVDEVPDIQQALGSCAPSCNGAVCGADGCGGSCGTCPMGETCTGGMCVQGGGGACTWDPTWSQGSGANSWWVEYKITGGTTAAAYLEVVGVGTVTLSAASGKWVGPSSFSIAPGAQVVMHATDSLGDQAATQPFGYLSVTAPVTACGGACTPSCNGATCGADGCGGACGTCPMGDTCAGGMCVQGGGGACTWDPTWSQGSGADNWWVEYSITGGTTVSAYLEVVGVGTVTLSEEYGKWVGPASFSIANGAQVVVHATDSVGESAATQPFGYLSVTVPVTACGGACAPSCKGATCGADGCGGSCGTCPTGDACVEGACVQGGGGGCAWNPTWSQGSGANHWWVEYKITGGTTVSAYLDVVGLGTVTLTAASGKWVGPSSFSIPTGAQVVVHATDSVGDQAATQPFGYLSVSAPVTACGG